MDDLPTKYDYIVIGTGMTPSIIAGALSRVGKSVLHVDENEFYGEEWASFNLEGINGWITCDKTDLDNNNDFSQFLSNSERFVRVDRKTRCCSKRQTWSSDDNDGNWTKEKMLTESRKFNLDLSPRLLYSRGALVELLISSNIARYAEFKSVTRVLTYREDQLEVVPCSRSDVFATRHVSVVQKRMLVKILKSFNAYPERGTEFEGFEQKSFVDYLRHKKLDDQLIHYIVYAIAMGSDGMMCLEGVAACQKFLTSLGRYGNTPFICSLYGAGELPQCFCRLCAVYGGVYHLNCPIDGFVIDETNQMTGLIANNRKLEAGQFVVTSTLIPSAFFTAKPAKRMTRGIFITDKSLLTAEKETVTLLQFPPSLSNPDPVTVMELGGSCYVCPSGLFVVHMTTQGNSFQHVIDALFGQDSKPRVLWSLVWEMDPLEAELNESCPENFKTVPGPDFSLDYDEAVDYARRVFGEICPDEEFLPRAPDSDEIVLEDPVPVAEPVSESPETVQEEEIS